MSKPISPIRRVNKLYSRCLDMLETEVGHLFNLGIASKLPAGASKDLVAYVKLFAEMKKAHAEILSEAANKKKQKSLAKTDAELEAAIKNHS